jgi:hypothetical protein
MNKMKIKCKHALIIISSFAISIIVLISVHLNVDISSNNAVLKNYRPSLNDSVFKIPSRNYIFDSPLVKSVMKNNKSINDFKFEPLREENDPLNKN